MTDSADIQLSRRTIRDRSIALLLGGIALLMPPIVGISLIDGSVAGIPIPLLYLFCVWAFLIAGAALLARPLRNSETYGGAVDGSDRPG